ncbi:MAG TPA: hypothetical protein VJ944_02710 [Thermoplasmataceae archaeon]|nr:hypothetical protein [Thermoplasmataceae archaeon]
MAKRSIPILTLIAVEDITAGLGIISGIVLLSDPSGDTMGMGFMIPMIPLISDFTAVGAWLLIVFGIFPGVLAYGLWAGRSWSLFGSFFLGAIEIVWIAVQVILLYSVGFSIWQAIIPLMAVFAIFMFFAPGIRAHFPYWQRKRLADRR